MNYFDWYGFISWSDAANAGLSVFDFVSGVTNAFGAGVIYGASTLAGGTATPLGTAGYLLGTSRLGAAFADINDSSKKIILL